MVATYNNWNNLENIEDMYLNHLKTDSGGSIIYRKLLRQIWTWKLTGVKSVIYIYLPRCIRDILINHAISHYDIIHNGN